MASVNIDIEKPKPHNGEKISKIVVSPKGDYIVTYSENDKSIVCWNIKDPSQLVAEKENSYPLSSFITADNRFKSDYLGTLNEYTKDEISAWNNYLGILNDMETDKDNTKPFRFL